MKPIAALIGLILAVSAAGAADLPVHPTKPGMGLGEPAKSAPAKPTQPTAAPPQLSGPSEQDVFVPPTPQCRAWSDGCRTCQRGESGVSCSNVGIACQPAAVVVCKD